MITNYTSIARENRVKALMSLKSNRENTCAVSGFEVHPKTKRRAIEAMFISTRACDSFGSAAIH